MGDIFDEGLKGSIFQLLRDKCGVTIAGADTFIKGVNPNNTWDELALVYLKEPVVLLEQLHVNDEGIPVLFLLRKAANVFLLTFNFLAISALLVPASSIALIFSSFPVSYISSYVLPWDVQLLSGGDSACKSLTGTLGNQVAFYLCGKGKSECQYLRLYIISQLIFLFHREQDDIFSTYMHSVYSLLPSIFFPNERSPTQSMYPLSLFFSIVRQAFCLWLTVFLKPFLPPTHQLEIPLFGKTIYLEPLVLYSLFIS